MHDIQAEVQLLDSANPAALETAWQHLKPLGGKVLPDLAAAYPTFKTWQGRAALLYYSTPYARTHDESFRLACAALQDRSRVVRYRACGVLAYSLKAAALQPLQPLLTHADRNTVEDAKAAMDAITNGNHHRFMDRSHSGRSFWEVQKGDVP